MGFAEKDNERTAIRPVSPCARFPTGPLPVEYEPLNAETLRRGDYFGPLHFKVTTTSHARHMAYLDASPSQEALTPFEMWPCARTISQWKFGRVNEVISLEAKRRVFEHRNAGDELWAETLAERVSLLRGICIAKFLSRTWSSDGQLLMESEDTLLLANGSNRTSLRETVRRTTSAEFSNLLCDLGEMLDTWTLQMRFSWPEDLWRNNVHTSSYANELGFSRPLVEGPAVADRIWHLCGRADAGASSPKLIEWRYHGPLYEGVRANLFQVGAGEDVSEMLVLERSTEQPHRARVLMSIGISTL